MASDDATPGSVIAKAERIRPSSNGSSQCSCCSGLPNCSSTSIFPESGAWQFTATGANAGLRPVSSASGAYCRLVSPAPRGPGRNRFHKPAALALARSSLMTGAVDQSSPGVARR